jgi:hypothetical protein
MIAPRVSKCGLYTAIEVVLLVMLREYLQSISILMILSFSKALTYSLSPGSHQYAHFEVLIVNSFEHNLSKVEAAWISNSYHRPIYLYKPRECYLQQARSA